MFDALSPVNVFVEISDKGLFFFIQIMLKHVKYIYIFQCKLACTIFSNIHHTVYHTPHCINFLFAVKCEK